MGTRTTFEKVINSEIEDKLQGKTERDPLHSTVAVLSARGNIRKGGEPGKKTNKTTVK